MKRKRGGKMSKWVKGLLMAVFTTCPVFGLGEDRD